MTTRIEKHGRNLHIWPEGITEPFVIKPLPGNAGVQITDTYLQSSAGAKVDIIQALKIAVDGGRENAITGRWEPLPEDEQVNFQRIGRELSQEEGNGVIMPALFWQTLLGMDGVKLYLEEGEGLAGTLKAVGALVARLGLYVPKTSPKESGTA